MRGGGLARRADVVAVEIWDDWIGWRVELTSRHLVRLGLGTFKISLGVLEQWKMTCLCKALDTVYLIIPCTTQNSSLAL